MSESSAATALDVRYPGGNKGLTALGSGSGLAGSLSAFEELPLLPDLTIPFFGGIRGTLVVTAQPH